MFTGIIRNLGVIKKVSSIDEGVLLEIAPDQNFDIHEGDSIAVNGACLTALTTTTAGWTVRLMKETIAKTNLGSLEEGSRVNLERPLKATQQLDGHFVLGHVDTTCTITTITDVQQDKIFSFSVTPEFSKYIIPKGSIALDGVSLTVVDIEEHTFTVSMMPYTLQHTTFGATKIDDRINVEVDVLGKYVERLLQSRLSAQNIK